MAQVVGGGSEGPGVGTTKHPKTEGEDKPFKSEVAGVGVTVDTGFTEMKLRSEAEGGGGAMGSGVGGAAGHPKIEVEEKLASDPEAAAMGSSSYGVGVTVDMGFARLKLRSEAEGGGVDIDMDKKAMYAYAVLGSRVGRHAGRSKNPAGGKKNKKKKVVRYSKEYIEMKMREPRPVPHRRMSDEMLDLLGNPARRAQEDELTAEAQKAIDRDAEMRRQYAIQGYADIELTDEEYEDEGRIDWRPWAYLKAAGLVDDYGQPV